MKRKKALKNIIIAHNGRTLCLSRYIISVILCKQQGWFVRKISFYAAA